MALIGSVTGSVEGSVVKNGAVVISGSTNLSLASDSGEIDITARQGNIDINATAGTIDFLTSSPSGTSQFKLRSIASATATRDVTIPEDGVLFESGLFIQYTVSTFLLMTVFHA